MSLKMSAAGGEGGLACWHQGGRRWKGLSSPQVGSWGAWKHRGRFSSSMLLA